MKKSNIRPAALFLLTFILVFGGCQSRSISNMGSRYGSDSQGELNELSVLGVTIDEAVSDEEIAATLYARERTPVVLQRADVLAVIQSGARFPDKEMVDSLKPLSTVVPLSGIPPENREFDRKERRASDSVHLDRSLRLAAAKGGANKILVYWGILESAAEPEQAAKQLSWVPLAGRLIPDETQHMQIRVKAALIDVKTGNWTMLRTKPMQDKRMSSRLTRQSSDLKQILALKEKAYGQFANDLKVHFLD